MSELTTRFIDDTYAEYYNTGKHELAKIYLKSEVDNVLAKKDMEIAELKAKIIKSKELADGIRCDIEKVKADAAETLALLEERNRQVGELKAKLDSMTQQFSKYVVDANNRERRPKRALYKACANWAKSERYTEATWHGDEHREELWAEVQEKCLKKAEEYK